MALTFREQIEATAWELGNGEGTTPELRKRFDADSETPNQTEIIELLKDDGSSARKTTVLTAINRLLEGEWISNRSGRNNRNIYASVRPYRQMDDPKSDAFVDRMSREEASELEDENHLEI